MEEYRVDLVKYSQSADEPFSHRERRRHGDRDRTICGRLCPCSADRSYGCEVSVAEETLIVLTIVIEVRA